jgi:glutamine synthetase
VKNFMQDAEFELYKLGIPVKTRHNEVAPSQFELAPIFEQVNISADHNALTMEVLKRVAIQHDFVCLLHEKPFAGINGSGKHNNWSMSTDKGENLLEPGKTPHQNLRFLAVLAVVLRAVHNHAAMMRTSIASPGNDHRLGANEAPPAIISVFLGKLLEEILNNIEKGHALKATEAQIIDLGVSAIPNISKDYTDRNRTSPFAFTGNKFEFRAVGSSQNVSFPMTVLNAAVADSFKQSRLELEKILTKKKTKDEAVMELIQSIIKETKPIRFDGNGYSDEWKKEAKKRSLPILNSSAEALVVMEDKKLTQFLSDLKVLSQEEISSRFHIYVERFVKTLEIEHQSLIELCNEFVIPSIERQLLDLYNVNSNVKNSNLKKNHRQRIDQLEKQYNDLLKNLSTLEVLIEKSHKLEPETKKMQYISQTVKPAAEKLRKACDSCEMLVANENWTLPKYREMLFFHTLG